MIVETMRPAYYAPTRKRYFFTLKAACNAEVNAIIKDRYPNERAEYENGHMISPDWHWTSLPRADVMKRRMTRLVMSAFKASKRPEGV